MALTLEEKAKLDANRAEIEVRLRDPLKTALASRTSAQRVFLESRARQKVAEGGNQSGKSETLCIDFLASALGVHPTDHWTPPAPGAVWKGWYSTNSYQLFAEQVWHHFKRLLLYPDELVPLKPGQRTRRILDIGWDTKAPERPTYLKIKRADGYIAEVNIKSYEQGRAQYQSAEVDKLALDEEAPNDIYEEAQPRILRRGGQIVVAATPVNGVLWLEDLRARFEAGDASVFHTRLRTYDNPSLKPEDLAELTKQFKDYPHLARLRLEGFPVADEGRVYPDTIFNVPGRVVRPFDVSGWTKYRCIDHGVHVVAALWLAVGPGRKKIALFREYYGQDVEPVIGKGLSLAGVGDKGNAANVLKLSLNDGGEVAYAKSWIDRATLGAGQETGKPLIELWRAAGVRCEPSVRVENEAGIERVKQLMCERGADGGPLFVVFDTCTNYLRERRVYSRQPKREKGDVGLLRPFKRDDHLQDDLKYLVAGGLDYVPWRPPPPPEGTMAREFWDERNPAPKSKL